NAERVSPLAVAVQLVLAQPPVARYQQGLDDVELRLRQKVLRRAPDQGVVPEAAQLDGRLPAGGRWLSPLICRRQGGRFSSFATPGEGSGRVRLGGRLCCFFAVPGFLSRRGQGPLCGPPTGTQGGAHAPNPPSPRPFRVEGQKLSRPG